MVYWVSLIITGSILVGFGLIAYLARGRSGFLKFVLRYLAVFVFFLFAEALVVWGLPSVHSRLSSLTGETVTAILRPAGIDATAMGSLVILREPDVTCDITVACLGGLLLWVFLGLVWAETKVTHRQRLIGTVAGIATLLLFNLSRITLTVYVQWAAGFDIHDIFYAINMVFVLLLWGAWLRVVQPRSGTTGGLRRTGRLKRVIARLSPWEQEKPTPLPHRR